MQGLEYVIKIHEELLERPLTKYEFRLVRSVYYTTVGEILKKERLDEDKTHTKA